MRSNQCSGWSLARSHHSLTTCLRPPCLFCAATCARSDSTELKTVMQQLGSQADDEAVRAP